MVIKIKPLSVNEAWQGRRFKTYAYKTYEKELLLKLKTVNIPEGRLILCVTFGVSNSNSDWDNPVKPFQDVLQKKYRFNDSRIAKAFVEKEVVKKGDEFIHFILLPEREYEIVVRKIT